MFLILDGNNIAWAGYYGLERAMKPETPERHARVALLGLAGMALGAIARGGTPPGAEPEPLSRVAICFDEGRPLRRRAIYAPYQTGREADPKFIGNEPTILGAIAEFSDVIARAFPFEVLRLKNTEADDFVAALVAKSDGAEVRICSGDRDFYQLLRAGVTIYSPIKKVVIDETNFFEHASPKTSAGERIDFPRDRFLDYRAVSGDASDTLTGVPGVGALSAARMLAQAPLDAYFGDAMAVRDALGRKSAALESAFADGTAQQIVARNRTLMDLRVPSPPWQQLEAATTRGSWDRPAADAWIAEQKITALDPAQLTTQLERLTQSKEGRSTETVAKRSRP